MTVDTLEDEMPEWFGRYKDENEARRAIAEHMAPKLQQLMCFVQASAGLLDENDQQVAAPAEFVKAYNSWRMEYEHLLGEFYDRFRAKEEPAANAEEQLIHREHFVREIIELDEREAIEIQVNDLHPRANKATHDAEITELETLFGTVRNQYLRAEYEAGEQAGEWVQRISKQSRGGRSIAGDDDTPAQ